MGALSLTLLLAWCIIINYSREMSKTFTAYRVLQQLEIWIPVVNIMAILLSSALVCWSSLIPWSLGLLLHSFFYDLRQATVLVSLLDIERHLRLCSLPQVRAWAAVPWLWRRGDRLRSNGMLSCTLVQLSGLIWLPRCWHSPPVLYVLVAWGKSLLGTFRLC